MTRPEIALRAFASVVYREAKDKYLTHAVVHFAAYLERTSAGSRRAEGQRYNTGAFGAVYFSLDRETPLRELQRTYARLLDTDAPEDIAARRVLFTVDVSLHQVADLTAERERARWRVREEDLVHSSNWTHCQSVSERIRSAGAEGIVVPSATLTGRNLVLFPDRLQPGSSIRLVDAELISLR